MYKIQILFISFLLLSACSGSYDELDEHKTRVEYAGLELRLPKLFIKEKANDYSFQSKDKAFSMVVYSSAKGFADMKQRMLDNKDTSLWRKFILRFFNDNDIEEQTRFDNYQHISYARKYGEDGFVVIKFDIDSNSDEMHGKFSAIARASLQTLSFLETDIDRSAGLDYSVAPITDMSINYRMNTVVGYQKNDIRLAVSYLDNSFLEHVDQYIDYNLVSDKGLKCEDNVIEQSDIVVVSGKTVHRELRSQQCDTTVVKQYLTRVPHHDNTSFIISTRLSEDKGNRDAIEFYNEFLAKLSFNKVGGVP